MTLDAYMQITDAVDAAARQLFGAAAIPGATYWYGAASSDLTAFYRQPDGRWGWVMMEAPLLAGDAPTYSGVIYDGDTQIVSTRNCATIADVVAALVGV